MSGVRIILPTPCILNDATAFDYDHFIYSILILIVRDSEPWLDWSAPNYGPIEDRVRNTNTDDPKKRQMLRSIFWGHLFCVETLLVMFYIAFTFFFFFLVFWFYYQSLNSTFHKQYRALLIIITININRRLFEINAKRDKSLNINFYEYVNIKYSRFFFIVMYLGCFYVIS